MAATLTPGQELTYVSFPIEKTETTEDGNVIVYGKATDGSVDSDEQIVDTEFSSKAIADWLATGPNVRVQHQAQRDPAGVGIESNTDAEGATWVRALVVEPVAKALVLAKALRAYSVGIARPKVVRDSVARGGRIVAGEIVEISLVDRPANKNCGVQLVKAEGDDGHAVFTGKAFGTHDLITKGSAAIIINEDELDAPEPPKSSTFSPNDMMKLLAHRAVAEKRQNDPNVGGGVDRDKIPAEDFAGRDRSFPIVKPGDVQDAASSIGRAGPDNYSSDELRRRITSIAERKGPQFVAQLPDAWTSPASKAEKPNPFAGGDDKPEDDDEVDADKRMTVGDRGEGAATKTAKDCPKCGAKFHADSKLRRCDKCNAKLPVADKGERKPKSVKKKKIKSMCAGCGANIDVIHHFCPECGNDQTPEPVGKGHDFTCLGCGNELDDDEKYCPGCGKENPGYEGMNTKSGSSPGDTVPGSDTKPVSAHREPDGVTVEAFEADAGMTTTPDSQMKALMRLKSVGVPTDLGALHDFTCPAYQPDDVTKCYPDTGSLAGSVDVTAWQMKALDAATGSPLEEAMAVTTLWQHAVTLKGTDAEVVADVQQDSFKAFQDANPGPANFPSPTELSPTRFRRPVITAGQANRGPGYEGPNTHPVPSGGISASQFTQGFQSEGRAAESPSNKSGTANEVTGYPSTPGQPTRVLYQEAQRNAAASAMSAMHDHIAQTFPGVCPLESPGHAGQPPEGARPVPVAKADAGDEVTAATTPPEPDPEITKAAVDPATTPDADRTAQQEWAQGVMDMLNNMKQTFTAKFQEISDQIKATQDHAADLQKSVDALGDLPDPATAPFKGVAQSRVNKSASPAGAASVADTVERTQLMMMHELENVFRTSADPAQREAAWSSLVKMRGLGT